MFLPYCGGTFFAIPYLGLAVGLVPSLAIGAAAFGAGELLLSNNKTKTSLKESDRPLYEVLETAKSQNKEIQKIIPEIEDMEIRKDLAEIHTTVEKIISTVVSKPNKKKKLNNFFDYYLPVTVKIIHKYDEIENQRLSTREGKEFLDQAKKMIHDVNGVFQKQLGLLYQSDLVDADAELKLFDTMLKSDGFDSDDFDIYKKGEK